MPNCGRQRTGRNLPGQAAAPPHPTPAPEKSQPEPAPRHLHSGSRRSRPPWSGAGEAGSLQRALPGRAAKPSLGVRRPPSRPNSLSGLGCSGASRARRAGAGAPLANPDPTRCLAAEGLRLSHPRNWPHAFALHEEEAEERQTARPPRLPDCPINKVWSKLPLPGKRRARKLSC